MACLRAARRSWSWASLARRFARVPVRVGDRLKTYQVVNSVSDFKTTKLGTGRFWEIEIVYENQNGEHVGKELYTGFGYKRS